MEWTKGRLIGRGSSATVHVATCHNSEEILAVKSAELHRSASLQREVKILSSLNSPNVIRYRGFEITTDPRSGEAFYNFLMEYAPYGTLTDAAKKNGGRIDDETQFVKYTRQLVQGLEYIHSKGIAHCDIKGRNVVIAENGEAKIADFGCAKRVDPEIDQAEDPIMGTPLFMAPEVARGEKQGKESDIWAVGCTVIEMVTGLPPWNAADLERDPISLLYRVGYSGETPELPCLLTEQAKDFLEKCLKKEANERWTATQLLNHPFLLTKPDGEPVLNSGSVISNSPTSVTDQTFWRTVEEEEEEEEREEGWLTNLDRLSLLNCHVERIERLGCVGGGFSGPRWDMEGGDWIMVRRNND